MMDIGLHILNIVLLAVTDHGEQAVSHAGHDTSITPALLTVVRVGVIAIIVGMTLCLYRIVRGPSLSDRVLAADAFALHVVGLVILLGVVMRTTIYFDAALIVGIIGFASTVAFAQYIHACAKEGIEP